MATHSCMNKTYPRQFYIVVSILLVTLLGNGWLLWQREIQKDTIAELSARTSTQTNTIDQQAKQLSAASSTILSLRTTIENVREDLDELEDDYREEKNKNDDFEDQIRNISRTVGDLDKLSKTDEELLQKYSRVYFLNENYVPSDLDKIDDTYLQDGKEDQYFHGDAMSFLEDMFDEAEDDGFELEIVSAYRSFDEQNFLKGQHTLVYGEGANTFSADQGFSEHQLGTTIDITIDEVGGAYTSFAETEAYEWLEDNAHKYGFILSYPEDNSFYVFEPWHWRFVGVDLAKDLHRKGDHFYDWEQREIDEYLIKIFD